MTKAVDELKTVVKELKTENQLFAMKYILSNHREMISRKEFEECKMGKRNRLQEGKSVSCLKGKSKRIRKDRKAKRKIFHQKRVLQYT